MPCDFFGDLKNLKSDQKLEKYPTTASKRACRSMRGFHAAMHAKVRRSWRRGDFLRGCLGFRVRGLGSVVIMVPKP